MASFQALPTVLVHTIFSFVPNHRAVCNLGFTCTEFQAISQQDRFWGALYRRRWKLASASHGYSRQGYKQRHLQENHVTGLIRTLSTLTDTNEIEQGVIEIARLVDDGIVECCWKVFQDENETTKTRMLARILVRQLHSVHSYRRLVVLRDQAQPPANEDCLMEDVVIAVNQLVYDLDGPTDTTTQWIQEQLDSIARDIRGRFSVGAEPSPQVKLETMKRVFDEMHFIVHPASLEVQSNRLHLALMYRFITNLNMLFLYKFVGRRLGLHVDIVDRQAGGYKLANYQSSSMLSTRRNSWAQNQAPNTRISSVVWEISPLQMIGLELTLPIMASYRLPSRVS